jgi:FlgD Ig-like domain
LPPLPRLAPLLLVLAVLVASGASFAISEGLKVQRAAVTAVRIPVRIFSPVCRCPSERVGIGFRLTRSDRLNLTMVDADGRLVRTLVRKRLFSRGAHHFTWNGRDDDGVVVVEGKYRPRVRLLRTDKTIVLPNPITVDVTPPRIRVVSVRPRVISPDGDGRSDVVRVRYQIGEHAHALLFVAGRQAARTKFQRRRDNVNWYGSLAGRRLPPGTYRLQLAAVDLAGNGSKRVAAGTVRIRYLELATHAYRLRPHAPIAVRVSSDAKILHYVLRRGVSVVASGSWRGRGLTLHAPRKPGRYVLVIRTVDHSARATVIVRKR